MLHIVLSIPILKHSLCSLAESKRYIVDKKLYKWVKIHIFIQMTPQFSDKARSMNNEDDYGLDDLSSGDETDDEDNPRKNIPNWAKKFELTDALRRIGI